MAVSIDVRGQGELRALSRALREYGDKDLRREFYAALQRASRPLVDTVREEAKTLPRRGGLADYVSGAIKGRTTARGGSNPRVSVVFSAASEASEQFKRARSRDVRRARRRHKAALARRAKQSGA